MPSETKTLRFALKLLDSEVRRFREIVESIPMDAYHRGEASAYSQVLKLLQRADVAARQSGHKSKGKAQS